MAIETLLLADDGRTPNHPRWPLILYRAALLAERLAGDDHGFDRLFATNGWPVGFRNGIYRFTHFHSVTHEVLGIARGRASVQFGGDAGPIAVVVAGDAALLPAGTGHRLIESDTDLLVIGAYPPGAGYDLIRADKGADAAVRARIAVVARPATDPVGGETGAVMVHWHQNRD